MHTDSERLEYLFQNGLLVIREGGGWSVVKPRAYLGRDRRGVGLNPRDAIDNAIDGVKQDDSLLKPKKLTEGYQPQGSSEIPAVPTTMD